jgi:hypothetical protein
VARVRDDKNEDRAHLLCPNVVNEVLRFPISVRANIRRFDEITVILLTDVEHFQVGPKVAIQQFEPVPR